MFHDGLEPWTLCVWLKIRKNSRLEVLQSLADQQVTTLQSLACCLTLPGTSPSEDQLKRLLNRRTPPPCSAACVLMFEAQAMSLAALKQTIEHTEDRKVELAPAEAARVELRDRTRMPAATTSSLIACWRLIPLCTRSLANF